MVFEVLYQNVRGLRTKSDVFSLNLRTLDVDIVCLTETWLNSDFFWPNTYRMSTNASAEIAIIHCRTHPEEEDAWWQ